MKRMPWLSLAAAVLALSLAGCGVGTGPPARPATVGDLAWKSGGDAAACTVYVREDGRDVPFLVLTNQYSGNTLLLRRDLLPVPGRISSYSAYYGDSDMDAFLNGDYARRLGDGEGILCDVEIPVTAASALGVAGTETESLTRQVFLLSCGELDETSLPNAGTEGRPLAYFRSGEHRAACYEDGTAGSWWTRTPNTYYLSCTYGVGADGALGSGNAYEENGIRPAFCVPSSTPVSPEEGHDSYRLSPEG